jgi:hypothetical protein
MTKKTLVMCVDYCEGLERGGAQFDFESLCGFWSVEEAVLAATWILITRLRLYMEKDKKTRLLHE